MSESGLVRLVNAGSYLYMKPSSRSGLNRVRALNKSDATATIAVEATEQADHFEKERYWAPVVLTSSNNKLDFVAEDGGGELNAQVAEGTYTSPHLLALAVRDALHDADPGSGNREYTVSWDASAFKFTISHHEDNDPSVPAYFDALWSTGANTAETVGALLGFDTGSDDLSTGDAFVTGEVIGISTGGADVLPATANIPITDATVYANGVALTITTDYTINLTTGVVTLVDGQTSASDEITIDYTWQSPLANWAKTSDNALGTEVSWSAGPNLVVVGQGLKDYDLPVGTLLRFKADQGVVELTFYGSYDDPPYSKGPQE